MLSVEQLIERAKRDQARFFELGSDGMLHAVLDRLVESGNTVVVAEVTVTWLR